MSLKETCVHKILDYADEHIEINVDIDKDYCPKCGLVTPDGKMKQRGL